MIQIRQRERPDGGKGPRFAAGDLVRHRRYGYRGVIADFDTRCTAPDDWYLANKTQPRKDQPWYHVLVDGTYQSTYAAEDSLDLDYSDAEITHPLIGQFFKSFEGGRYVRNDRPWE